MKKFILALIGMLVMAGAANAAQQTISQITTPTTSREALRNAVNVENAKTHSNFVELYAATPNDTSYGSAWNNNLRAPSMNAVYDKIEALILGSGNMVFPGSTGITVFNGTTWGDSLNVVTTVGATGADTNVATEQAVREAITTSVGTGQPGTLTYTANAAPSAADLLANKFITNAGATGTIAVILPAISYEISRAVIVEDDQIIQVTPPTGEAFDLSGTTLTANQSFAGPATVGSKIVITRQRNAAGTWIWSADVVRGTWAGI